MAIAGIASPGKDFTKICWGGHLWDGNAREMELQSGPLGVPCRLEYDIRRRDRASGTDAAASSGRRAFTSLLLERSIKECKSDGDVELGPQGRDHPWCHPGTGDIEWERWAASFRAMGVARLPARRDRVTRCSMPLSTPCQLTAARAIRAP